VLKSSHLNLLIIGELQSSDEGIMMVDVNMETINN